MTAQLVTDALVMAIWRRGKPDALLHHSDRRPVLPGTPSSAPSRPWRQKAGGVAARQETAALRDFNPAYVSVGSGPTKLPMSTTIRLSLNC